MPIPPQSDLYYKIAYNKQINHLKSKSSLKRNSKVFRGLQFIFLLEVILTVCTIAFSLAFFSMLKFGFQRDLMDYLEAGKYLFKFNLYGQFFKMVFILQRSNVMGTFELRIKELDDIINKDFIATSQMRKISKERLVRRISHDLERLEIGISKCLINFNKDSMSADQ